MCVFLGVSFPVCIVSFLCSFSWTSFHLLDSSMRLAHSHSHSLTLCNSLSLSLCVWWTILAFLCSIHFILLPSSLPASSFPFALCPALAADLPLLYIMVLSSQYAVPVLVHVISSFPSSPSLPLSLLAFLPLFYFSFVNATLALSKNPALTAALPLLQCIGMSFECSYCQSSILR